MKRNVLYNFLGIVLVTALSLTGCSSSMGSFQSPAVKNAQEIKGAWIMGNTNSMELQTTIGLGYNIDASIKLSPLFPLTITETTRRFPIDVDMKYQLLSEPIFASAGIGWSNLVTRNKIYTNRIRNRSESTRSYILFGTKFLYGGITANYLTMGKSFVAGESQEYVLSTNTLFFSYTIGTSIGKNFRLNPEVTLLPTNNVLRYVWGVSFEFTGLFKL